MSIFVSYYFLLLFPLILSIIIIDDRIIYTNMHIYIYVNMKSFNILKKFFEIPDSVFLIQSS